jgi:uncharacterized BrkB/YihY/UPF0761 family membrane protein
MPPRTFLQVIKAAGQRWIDRDAFEHAVALGFCTLFSLAPLVIIVVAIVGVVFGEDAASGQISVAISDLVLDCHLQERARAPESTFRKEIDMKET